MDLYQRVADRTGLERYIIKKNIFWLFYSFNIIKPHQTYQELEDTLVKYLGGK